MQESYSPTLKNLIDQKSLRWVFVGGKGGVGKTTTTSSIGVRLAQERQSVLIISTDPAHNLSDAFNQKFSNEPTKVKNIDNLYCMQIDPSNFSDKFGLSSLGIDIESNQTTIKDILSEMFNSIPGIDQATSFGQVMKLISNFKFQVILFDTAPTGHTLRLLNFPNILDKALTKLMQIKDKFAGIISKFGGDGSASDDQTGQGMHKKIFTTLQSFKKYIEEMNKQFKDPTKTTFVAVCIPEFLSLFQTERLVIELAKYNIDIHNIVINQVLVPDQCSSCKMCKARNKMQKKYVDQIRELYDQDFHITISPLLEEEVRGVDNLKEFSVCLFDKEVQYQSD